MGIILGTIAAIAAAATTVTKALAVVGLAVQGLKVIANALTSLGKALGLIRPETKVEDLGDKAIQSEYKPEDFDSYEAYVKAVEEYELDPEKSKLTTEEEKIIKGMELSAGVCIEKYKGFPMPEFCVAVGENPEYFSDDKIVEIGKLLQTDGQLISGILDHINHAELDDAKVNDVINTLLGIEKSVNPSISDVDALRNVMSLQHDKK